MVKELQNLSLTRAFQVKESHANDENLHFSDMYKLQ